MIASSVQGSPAEKIDWYSFLARPRLPAPGAESIELLREKSILITGAGGSIGSELAMRLAGFQPRRLILLDASEQAVHRLGSRLAAQRWMERAHVVLGNVSCAGLMDEIFSTHLPQLVFHAAAYKHLPLLERHPLEAIENNSLSTQTVMESARRFGAPRVVLLSTDKAADPTSILGASKRIAERITLAHGEVVLRLANVLGTEGSAAEVFLRQIAAGGPVSITDRASERYFLTSAEAVDLLLRAALQAPRNSLLAPKLACSHRVVDLAEFLISTYAQSSSIELESSGLRPGEKIQESLLAEDETPLDCNMDGVTLVARCEVQTGESHWVSREIKLLETAVRERDLATLIEVVLHLVPRYSPSTIVHSLVQNSIHGVSRA